LFIEHKWVSKNGNWLILPGVYVNYYSDYGLQAFPGLETSYLLGKNSSLFASVSRSFRVPTYTDLYYVGPTNVGNSNLQPEEAINSELGFKFLKPSITVQSALFWRSANSLIDWVRTTENEPWVPQNFYSANFYGLEFQSTILLNKLLNYSGNTAIGIQYTYIESRLNNSTEFITRYALDNLQQQAILTITQSFLKKAYVTLGLRYADRVTYKDYALLNCKIGYQNKGLNIFVNGSNLTNTEYVEAGYVPMPGLWLTVGASYNFQLKK
jgi:iron complex outermembrane receptor protein